MSELQIGENEYLCSRMPTRVQLHVAISMAPVFDGFRSLFVASGRNLISDGAGMMVPDIGNISIFDALAALSNTLRMIPLSDRDYVVDSALDAVRWKQAGRWMPLRINGALMLQAADRLDVQLRLTWEVLRESLENFSLETLLGSPSSNGMDQTQSLSP
jgi:hypothetical protein